MRTESSRSAHLHRGRHRHGVNGPHEFDRSSSAFSTRDTRRYSGMWGALRRARRGLTTRSVFAEEGLDFGDCGLSPKVVEQLRRAGFARPTAVQAEAIPEIASGAHTILLAETGSGKTLAYLGPIAERVAQVMGDQSTWQSKPVAVVLAPTQELVMQIVGVVERAFPRLAPHVRAAYGPLAPPRSDAFAVLVATPKALQDNVHPSLLREMQTLVLDEADMLLGGDYAQYTRDSLLREIRFQAGRRSKRPRPSSMVASEEGASSLASEDTATADLDAILDDLHDQDVDHHVEADADQVHASPNVRDRSTSSSPQVVFCAATLPSGGKQSVGAYLQRYFADAVVVASTGHHRTRPNIDVSWVLVQAQDDAFGNDAALAAARKDTLSSFTADPTPLQLAARRDELLLQREQCLWAQKLWAMLLALKLSRSDFVALTDTCPPRGSAPELGGLRTMGFSNLTVPGAIAGRALATGMSKEQCLAVQPTLVFTKSAQRAKDTQQFLAKYGA